MNSQPHHHRRPITLVRVFLLNSVFAALLLARLSIMHAAEPVAPYVPYVPEDKQLDPKWVASLFEKGKRTPLRGAELRFVAMPCGGIGAGQIEICGDGSLGSWWIFNQQQQANAGLGYTSGARYLKPAAPEKTVEHVCAIRVQSDGGKPTTLELGSKDFDDLRFFGEYPIATLAYRQRETERLPVEVDAEVFSPFVPLSVRDSANPVTVLRFSVRNTSQKSVAVSLAAWLKNAAFPQAGEQRLDRVRREAGATGVLLGVQPDPDAAPSNVALPRPPIRFDDFERAEYGDRWTASGEAFDKGPLEVASVRFNLPVREFQGQRMATSFPREGLENRQGRLVSRPFRIERKLIWFRIGGGKHAGKTCLNLLVDGKIVRTATGANSNTLVEQSWDVAEFESREAVLEIVDDQPGSWGFVTVDDIRFADGRPDEQAAAPRGNGHAQFGDMTLAVLDPHATASLQYGSAAEFLEHFRRGELPAGEERRAYAADAPGGGAVASSVTLAPGETHTITFLVAWYFPNLRVSAPGCPTLSGRFYSQWCRDSFDAARHVSENFDRLYGDTKLFRDTFYDSTLPYWLLQRISAPVSTLAADNITLWENGRMYAYEGVGFCFGTCGHVYNFVTAIAHLFPGLERSVRLMQDFDEARGFDEQSGRVNFRGHDGSNPEADHAYASDAQSGYVLKAHREHLMSPDNSFLDQVWPKVRRTIGYMIFHDGATRGVEPNGVLEDLQTFWDPMWYGPNPYNNTLYLAALRAAEEMARRKGETALADRYHAIFENGQAWMNARMWNGEYYVHLYPVGFHNPAGSNHARDVITPQQDRMNARDYIDAMLRGEPHYFVSTACDAQQTFGQNWAHQLGLGYILPPEHCRTAAASIFKYNWTPDIKAVYDLYPPKHRTLAASGEGALVNGAWPKARRQSFENIHDKDDIWTGLEYQAACDMINAGLLQQALIVLKAIDERYDARKRNPWNEIEGAEHYSRAMHSWNVLLALSGCTYDGPAGSIGFAPKITPENFKSFFSGAEGWGSFEQSRAGKSQTSALHVAYGKLRVRTLTFHVPDGANIGDTRVALAGGPDLKSEYEQRGSRVEVKLNEAVTVPAGQTLRVEMR